MDDNHHQILLLEIIKPGSYSTTSSASSFRQEGPGLRETSHYHRNSPLRDQYSSRTSSASTLIGGGSGSTNNQAPASFSTFTSRPDYSVNDRNDDGKQVTYKFDLNQFAPEDIAIQVNDTMLKVTALRQERDGHGSSQREFRREIGILISYLIFFCKSKFIFIGLPDGAEPKNLTNTLSADGILTIQIPVP